MYPEVENCYRLAGNMRLFNSKGQGTISALICTTRYYQLDKNSFLFLGTYFVLVYILTSTSLGLGQGTISA